MEYSRILFDLMTVDCKLSISNMLYYDRTGADAEDECGVRIWSSDLEWIRRYRYHSYIIIYRDKKTTNKEIENISIERQLGKRFIW